MGQAREWNFKVTLDGEPIGWHRFTLQERGDERELRSEARFSVKVLSFEVYRYEHEASERWRGGCLERIDSRTDDNGRRLTVEGRIEQDGLRIRRNGSDARLPGCIRAFAYWDSVLLAVPRLLDPQEGTLLDVTLTDSGTERVQARGATRTARRVQLKTPKLLIDLWYDAAGEWLALESTTTSGRRVRYRLEPD
jgi:hypothetical protein